MQRNSKGLEKEADGEIEREMSDDNGCNGRPVL